jgi:hypothetical protein
MGEWVNGIHSVTHSPILPLIRYLTVTVTEAGALVAPPVVTV